MGEVVLSSFNPYQDRYPHRRVITREQLHLMKLLRAQGVSVRVDGDPDDELNYLALKGLREWLSDPIVVTSLSIPIGVMSGLIANALSDLVKGRSSRSTDVLIALADDGSGLHYASDGRRLSKSEFNRLMRSVDRRYSIAHPARVSSPDASRPVPVYLEHTDKVVAWGRLSVDSVGLKVDEAVVTDDETWARLRDGSLAGMSIGALVRRSKCSICGESYFDCWHLSGNSYDGESCYVTIEELDLGEVSLVTDPANPLARVTKLERRSG